MLAGIDVTFYRLEPLPKALALRAYFPVMPPFWSMNAKALLARDRRVTAKGKARSELTLIGQ